MEFDSGFNFASSANGLLEGIAADPKADSEKILQEAREQDKPAEDDIKVTVDSAFRMEGGGYAFFNP